MKKIYLPFFFIFILAFNLSAQTKFISTKGKQLIGLDGKPFLMKGTNLGNWLIPEGYMFKFRNVNSPRLIDEVLKELIGPTETASFWNQYLNNYIRQKDIQYLKSVGVNSIRIPFNYRLFTNEPYLGSQGEARGFALLDKVINWCKSAGIFIILDMHAAPCGQTGDNIDDGFGYPFLFDDEACQQSTVSIWRKIAARYKNEQMILGYDLLNEPIATYFDSAHFNSLLEPLYKRITKAIREVDQNHVIILGGAQWDSNFNPFGTPFDKKLVYTFHKYWTRATQKVIQSYVDFSNKYNVPIYCGETGENTDQWVDSFRVLLDSNQIGWHFWPYKKIDNARCFVQFNIPQFYDLVIQYAETPKKNFEEIRKARPKDIEQIRAALNGFLNNCKFENCKSNNGYIQALGFKIVSLSQ